MSDPKKEFIRYRLGRAFEARMDTDYRVLATPDADELRESLEQARSFLSRVEQLLEPEPDRRP